MKKKILAAITAILAAIAIAGITIGIFNIYKRDTTAENISFPDKLGVWWWDNRIDDTYLNFAYEQGVTDIYYYASSFTQKISDFIEKADKKNIKVYWLCGKYEWIEDYAALYAKIEEYRNFQQQSKHKFAGIHFDIEPHQHPEFKSDRQRLITDYVRLTFSLSEIYQDMLRENGIPFVCRQEGAGGYLKILLGVGIIPDNIYVAEKNYERAREIYEAYLLTEPPEDDDGDISGE